MIVRKTRPEEARRINEIFSVCFETPYSNCPADTEHPEDIHWAAFDGDGEMMSSITVPEYTVRFDGSVVKMAGIGAVETLPQYRRRGGIRGCFEKILPDLYRRGFALSVLFPFSTAYYRQFGYECCIQKFGWEADLAQLKVPVLTGRFCLAEKSRPLTQAIQIIDRVWEQQFNMMVQHEDKHYAWTRECDPAKAQEFTYVWFDGTNAPKAYTTFRIAADRAIQCSRFCFTDKEGFWGLMQVFKSMAADHACAKFQTPAIPALQYLLPEWSLGAAKWELLASCGMVRVVSVQRILENAGYLGSGRVTLEVRDPQIPENTGCFALQFENGRAVTVSRTSEAPDIRLDISSFSALICGISDFDSARYVFSGLEILRENPGFRQMFYRKNNMIVDFF